MTEKPQYQVEGPTGPIELRAYGPMILAQATVRGGRRQAINDGFRLIAAYIFGGNVDRTRIAMTAPVQQAPSGPAETRFPDGEGLAWTVSFVMPRAWTLQTLPAPIDKRVVLKPLPARRFVVSRFSGWAGAAKIERKSRELVAYASAHQIATVGQPLMAFYNPPWTLPLLRRNEILLEVA